MILILVYYYFFRELIFGLRIHDDILYSASLDQTIRTWNYQVIKNNIVFFKFFFRQENVYKFLI